MSVKHVDSITKILSYLKKSRHSKFVLSRLFFRDYTCPSGCGGCCQKFSLDYFEGERWELFKKTYPHLVSSFEKRTVQGATVFTDWQKENESHYCKHLDLSNGRCKIHDASPFTCEFELIKFLGSEKSGTRLIKRLYGRGWNLTRVDGQKGALCEMIPFNPSKIERDLHLLRELSGYARRIGIRTKLPLVCNFIAINLDKLKQGKIPSKDVKF